MHASLSPPTTSPAAAGMGSVGDLIVRALSRDPARIAFIAGEHGEHVLSYGDCARAIGRVVGLFDRIGLQPGDVVAQFTRNRVEQWFVTAACYLMGLRSAGMPALLDAQVDQAALLHLVDARVFIGDRTFDARVPAYRSAAAGVRHWYSHDPGGALPCLWEAARTDSGGPLRNRAKPEDIARLAFTRGSTGPRKGVLLSGRALAAAALVNLADVDWPAGARVLCADPIAGGFGNFIVPTLLRGGTFVLQDGFDPARFADALARHHPSVALMFPQALERLLDAPGGVAAHGSCLDLLVYSGGCLGPDRVEQAHRLLGPVLCQVHGQTECPKSLSVLRPREHVATRLASNLLGMPCSGMQAAILRADHSECEPGEPGELCVRGPAVASGYWRRPDLTEHALRAGWWHTGDRCVRDERGYLYFVERLPAPMGGATGVFAL